MSRREEPSIADTLQGGARTGEVLAGKYRLERLLGRGGMGEVYEARHVVVGRRFAVKFLHAGAAASAGASARFLREAQAAGALESPHLAAVLDFDRAADGAPFLVMELLDGESLARVLQREQRLPLPRVLGLLLQAAAGLGVAHRAGIVHRDLKPDNLLLVPRADGSELLKIVDFGVAKLLDEAALGDVTQSGAVLGTPFYMAPEQARGERQVDQRVDIHALGVIAYELLSGTKPHPGESYNAILAHILTEPVEPLGRLCPTLPKALVAVIERAMAFDASARHPSIDALAADLARFAAREVMVRADAVDLTAASAGSGVGETRAETSDGDARRREAEGRGGEPLGTLQTAVGDVPAERRGSRRASSGWLLVAGLLVAIGGYAIWQRSAVPAETNAVDLPVNSEVLRSATEPLPGSARDAASAPSVVERSPHGAAAPPVEPAPAATPAPSASTAGAVARLPKTRPRPAPSEHRGVGSPPSTASAVGSPPVTFDETNPY